MKIKNREWFEKYINFSLDNSIYKNCPYYPCHKIPDGQEGLVCTFCYCPFYPCGIENRGGKWIKAKNKKLWDCTNCSFIHRRDVVKRIIELQYKDKSFSEISLILQEEFNGTK